MNIPQSAMLVKEATKLKKVDISKAVSLLYKALKITPLESQLSVIKKLADYERLNNNLINTIEILYHSYKDSINSTDYFMKTMYAHIKIDYIFTQLKKSKIIVDELKLEAEKLHIVALAVQARSDEVEKRVKILSKSQELQKFLLDNLEELKQLSIPQKTVYENDIFVTGKVINLNDLWKNDKYTNQCYDSMISTIDARIDEIIIKLLKTIN